MSVFVLIFAVFLIQITLKLLLSEHLGYTTIIISQIFVIFIPTLIYLISTEKKLGYFIRPRNRFILTDLLFAVLTAIAVNIISQYINYPIIRFIVLTGDISFVSNSVYDFIISIFFLCAIPAVLEEILFRGVVLGELSSKYSLAKASALSAIFFSLIHFDVANIVPQFVLGVVLAYMMVSSMSILVPITAHFFNNLFALLLRVPVMNIFSEYKIVVFLLAIFIAVIGVVYFNPKLLRREI